MTLALLGVSPPLPALGWVGAPTPVPVQAPVTPVQVAAPVDGTPTTVSDAAPPAVTIPGSVVPPAAATPMVRGLEIVGRGYGHGRGLGQWGALGYATDLGWTYDRILGHFYGGTGPGRVSPQSALGVRLTGMDDRVLIVVQASGRLWTAVNGQSGLTPPPSAGAPPALPVPDGSSPVVVPVAATSALVGLPTTTGPAPGIGSGIGSGIAPAGGGSGGGGSPAALRIELVAPGRFTISDGPGCSGPWTVRSTVDSVSVLVSPGPDPVADPDDPSQMLSVCTSATTRRVYRGDLVTVDGKPGQRTVNQASLEDYVRGVVPGEVPPGWGNKPNGMEALKAQAVAARSYSAAERRNGFSNTCDSDACQVYRGRGEYRGNTFTSFEDPKTDRAVRDTAGEVRVDPGTGAVIRTEFSSSTGGQSAPGQYPPVVDEGDNTPANPYRQWTVSLSASRLEAGRKLGAFRGIEITKRDGVGQFGGRVQNLRLIYAQGSLAMTSGEFLRKFNLRSTLFDAQVVERPVGDSSDPPSPDPVADGTSTSPDTAVPALAAADRPAPVTTVAKKSVAKKVVSTAKASTGASNGASTGVSTVVMAAASNASGAAKVQVAGRAQTAVQAIPVVATVAGGAPPTTARRRT